MFLYDLIWTLFFVNIFFKITKNHGFDSWLLHQFGEKKTSEIPGFKLDVLNGRCAALPHFRHFRGETKKNANLFGGFSLDEKLRHWIEVIFLLPMFSRGFRFWKSWKLSFMAKKLGKSFLKVVGSIWLFQKLRKLDPYYSGLFVNFSGFRIEIKKQMVLWHQWKSEFWNAFIVTDNWKLCLAISVVTWRFLYNKGLSCFWCPLFWLWVINIRFFLGGFLSDAPGPGQIPTKSHNRDLNLVNNVSFYGITRRRNHNCCELFVGCFRW